MRSGGGEVPPVHFGSANVTAGDVGCREALSARETRLKATAAALLRAPEEDALNSMRNLVAVAFLSVAAERAQHPERYRYPPLRGLWQRPALFVRAVLVTAWRRRQRFSHVEISFSSVRRAEAAAASSVEWETYTATVEKGVFCTHDRTFSNDAYYWMVTHENTERIRLMRSFLRQQLGKPTSDEHAIRVVLWPRLPPRQRAWYCSSLVAAALARGGIFPSHARVHALTVDDLHDLYVHHWTSHAVTVLTPANMRSFERKVRGKGRRG